MENRFNITQAYNYIFTDAPIEEIQPIILSNGKEFMYSLASSLSKLIQFLGHSSLFIIKIFCLSFPHIKAFIYIIYNYHVTQLDRFDIAIEISLILLVCFLMLFRKRISRAWRVFEKTLSEQYRAAAQVAPHVLFFGLSFIFSIIGRKFLIHLTSPSVMPIISLIVPLLRTLQSLSLYKSTLPPTTWSITDITRINQRMQDSIILWVVLGTYHAVVTFFSIIPFSSVALSRIPYCKEFAIIILIWIQLSPVFTRLVFEFSLPLLKKIASYISSEQINQSNETKNSVLIIMKYLRIINDKQLQWIRNLLQDGINLIVLLFFCCTPTPIATIGTISICLLIPTFKSASLFNSIESNMISEYALTNQNKWLDYWCCAGFLWLLRIYRFQLWPSVMMLIGFTLQHSYFNGASVLVKQFNETYAALRHRNVRLNHAEDGLTPLLSPIEVDTLSPLLLPNETDTSSQVLLPIEEDHAQPETIIEIHSSKEQETVNLTPSPQLDSPHSEEFEDSNLTSSSRRQYILRSEDNILDSSGATENNSKLFL